MVLTLVAGAGLPQAMASASCYQGNFAADNTVVTQNYNASPGWYVIQTWSYAGGIDPCGNVVPRGGLDPILTVFTGAGVNEIAYNDDGGLRIDPNTGMGWDSYILIYLSGNYTIALTQYDNFAVGPGLGNGFTEDGITNFTAGYPQCVQGMFCDVSNTPIWTNRTSLYDFSIMPIPEPSSMLLLGSGIIGLAGILRRKMNQ